MSLILVFGIICIILALIGAAGVFGLMVAGKHLAG